MALTITVEISDAQQKYLEHDLEDIDEWVQSAVIGKIKSCANRLVHQWQPVLMDDPEVVSIPADISEFIKVVQERPDYYTRKQRERNVTMEPRAVR